MKTDMILTEDDDSWVQVDVKRFGLNFFNWHVFYNIFKMGLQDIKLIFVNEKKPFVVSSEIDVDALPSWHSVGRLPVFWDQ